MKTSIDDKVAQTKISKIAHSARIRDKRIMSAANSTKYHPIGNSKHCYECGFHIRGKNHIEGDHHNGTVKPCHRGR